MFGVALDLKWADFRRVMDTPKSSLVGLLAQFVTMPALTYLLILVWKPDPAMALGMILVAACPGGNISNFLCQYARGNAALSVSISAISTIVAIFATPINFAFWSSLLPGTENEQEIVMDAWAMFQSILVILLFVILKLSNKCNFVISSGIFLIILFEKSNTDNDVRFEISTGIISISLCANDSDRIVVS